MYDSTLELDDFVASFGRSKRENLWRKLPDNRTATIFPGNFGGYVWCLADGIKPIYSEDNYETEEEAVASLFDNLQEHGQI